MGAIEQHGKPCARILDERFRDGREQRVLVFETEIDRTHRAAGFLCDIGQARAVITLFRKHGLGRLQQALARGGECPAFRDRFPVAACLGHAGVLNLNSNSDYDGAARPSMRPSQEKPMSAVVPTPPQIQRLIEKGPDGPIVMVNLLKYRKKAAYESGRPEAKEN